jgi:hypothetical protein
MLLLPKLSFVLVVVCLALSAVGCAAGKGSKSSPPHLDLRASAPTGAQQPAPRVTAGVVRAGEIGGRTVTQVQAVLGPPQNREHIERNPEWMPGEISSYDIGKDRIAEVRYHRGRAVSLIVYIDPAATSVADALATVGFTESHLSQSFRSPVGCVATKVRSMPLHCRSHPERRGRRLGNGGCEIRPPMMPVLQSKRLTTRRLSSK